MIYRWDFSGSFVLLTAGLRGIKCKFSILYKNKMECVLIGKYGELRWIRKCICYFPSMLRWPVPVWLLHNCRHWWGCKSANGMSIKPKNFISYYAQIMRKIYKRNMEFGNVIREMNEWSKSYGTNPRKICEYLWFSATQPFVYFTSYSYQFINSYIAQIITYKLRIFRCWNLRMNS